MTTEIASVRWHHDMIIDQMIAHPDIQQNELAQLFGFSATWISIIVNSDAFQHRLKERKGELVDPVIKATVEERLNGVAKRALDKLIERLDTNAPFSNRELIATVDSAARGLGLGAAKQGPGVNLYVVNAPAPAPNATEWAKMAGGQVIDVTPTRG